MTSSPSEKIAELLSGEICRSVVGGFGAGSIIHVGLGNLIKRDIPLKNEKLSLLEREFDTSKSLFVSCAWRFTFEKGSAISWRDSGIDQTWDALSQLNGKKITNVSTSESNLDLKLCFEDSHVLDLFCDITTDYESDENYRIHSTDVVYTIGICSDFTYEKKPAW